MSLYVSLLRQVSYRNDHRNSSLGAGRFGGEQVESLLDFGFLHFYGRLLLRSDVCSERQHLILWVF
jgi:hypothetical protein